MHDLRKRARGLYPKLNKSNSKYAQAAKQRLDAALTNSTGIIDPDDPKMKELMRACDLASNIPY